MDEPKSVPELLAQLKEKQIPPEQYAIHVRRFLDYKARLRGAPLSGKFELTPLCNLDCKMCYVHLQKDQMGDSALMPPADWKKIMTEAANLGMMEALLTGGECLTYPHFDEVYLHLHDLGVETVVYTNGVLMDESRIAFFKSHPVKEIQVSLYGSSEDAYEKVTGQRQFERVLNNLKAAKEAQLPLRIAITPSVYMQGDVENIIRLAHSLDLPFSINWSLFDPRENTGRSGQSMDLPTEDYIGFYKLQRALVGKDVQPLEPSELPDFGGPNQGVGKGLRCGGGRSGFSIGYDGKMYICGMLRKFVAHPLDTGFEEAWRFINDAAENYPVPLKCLDCKYRAGCPICVVHHEMGGEVGQANPRICERTRRMVLEGISLLS